MADEADVEWLRGRGCEADPANRIEVVQKPRRWHAAIAPFKTRAPLQRSRRPESAGTRAGSERKVAPCSNTVAIVPCVEQVAVGADLVLVSEDR